MFEKKYEIYLKIKAVLFDLFQGKGWREITAQINEFYGEALIQFNKSQEFLEKFKLMVITLAHSQLYPTSEGVYKQAEEARKFLCPLLEERNLISKFPQLISSMDDKEKFHAQSQNQSGGITVGQFNGTWVSMDEKGTKESSWVKWGVIITGISILTPIIIAIAQ